MIFLQILYYDDTDQIRLLDVEIQNVLSLVNKHETKFSDFDDKLLR